MSKKAKVYIIENQFTPFTLVEINGKVVYSCFKEINLLELEEKQNIVGDFNQLSISNCQQSKNAMMAKAFLEGKIVALNQSQIQLNGTAFQQKVWNAIRQIPYGETRSYGDVGKMINTRAYRAVGQACKNNQLALFIPCHRVIASNGSIGGYFGNIALKKELLNHEKKNDLRGNKDS